MERNAGAKNCCEDNIVFNHPAVAFVERGVYGYCLVVDAFADFVGHYLSDAFEIAAETEHVILYFDVTQLCQILADQRRRIVEIDYFHDKQECYYYFPTKLQQTGYKKVCSPLFL